MNRTRRRATISGCVTESPPVQRIGLDGGFDGRSCSPLKVEPTTENPKMSHSVKIYQTCIGCTQCVRACPTDVLEMVPWDGCKAAQIASAPRTEDCVGCKRCESACPTDFLSVRVYLGAETTRSMGLAY